MRTKINIMKLILSLLIISLISSLSFAQDFNKFVMDENTGNKILVGQLNLEGIKTHKEFKENFKIRYSDYHPDTTVTNKIRPLTENLDISIVLGTWCHDSKVQIPYFFRVLTLINYPEEELELIGIDRHKKAGDLDIRKLKIKRVPTFIFYRNGEELGRIIETPKKSLESDMLDILKKK